MYAGVFIFTAGILLNELVLMIQGVSDLYYVNVSYSSEMLLVIAIIMFSGITLVNISQRKIINKTDINHIL